MPEKNAKFWNFENLCKSKKKNTTKTLGNGDVGIGIFFNRKKNLVSIELFRQLSTTRTMTYMYQERGKSGLRCYFNPTTPMSDQDRISPNNINAISSKQVMRIKKSINQVTISGSNTNTEFFKKKKNHHNQTVRRITSEILEWES